MAMFHRGLIKAWGKVTSTESLVEMSSAFFDLSLKMLLSLLLPHPPPQPPSRAGLEKNCDWGNSAAGKVFSDSTLDNGVLYAG